jgi:uncharacterized short protein YbdD (DUF466 family)
MGTVDEMFLGLLCNGLWKTPFEHEGKCFTALSSKEWEMTSDLAYQQKVIELVYDGMLSLRDSLRPNQDLLVHLEDYINYVEQMHDKLNCAIVELINQFSAKNIPIILFNGQVNAQMYDNPLRRHCSDVDLYVERTNYRKACKLVNKWNVAKDNVDSKTMSFKWNDINVRLHCDVILGSHSYHSWKFRAWSEKMLSETPNWFDPFGKDIHLSVATPSFEFNVLFIFYRLYHQFLTGDLIFRDLCDWVRCLHSSVYIIDFEELKDHLNYFGLMRSWQMFGCVAVDVLNLPKEEFPFYDCHFREKANKIMNDVLHPYAARKAYLFPLFSLLPFDMSLHLLL